ncbi:MAG: hypothetical protein GHCLOJNM_04522 [bacterium]|nr:hypothetical protein [bacterium]
MQFRAVGALRSKTSRIIWTQHARASLLLVSLLFASAHAQEVAPARIDQAIDQLILLDPKLLAARLSEMKAKAEGLSAEAVRLRAEAAALDNRLSSVKGELASLAAVCQAVMDHLHPPVAPPSPEPAMAEAAPAPDTQLASEPEVNFEDHIKPIFASRCLRCHNLDKRRSGLLLETVAGIREGGSSGPVLVSGQPNASRLYRLISGQEEPKMPPSGDPIDPASLELIRRWIELGAPENKDSKVSVAASGPTAESGPVFVAATFRDGPPPMPESPLAPASGDALRGVVGRALAASPRSPLLAVGGYKQVLLFNLETQQWLGALPFQEGDIQTLSFSVNAELLLAGGGREGDHGTVVIWNIRTGERVAAFQEDYDVVLAADISPDHRLVALGGPNRKVTVFSMVDGKPLYMLDAHTEWIYAVKFTPDGELLATADRGGGLMLWQAANGRPVENLRGHEGAVHCLAYSPDSVLLASAGEDGTVQLWDTWQYTQVGRFSAHSGAVHSVEFTPSGEIVTTGADRQTKRWDRNGTNLSTYSELPDWGYRACYAPSASLVMAGSWNGEVRIWKADSGEAVANLTTAPATTTTAGAVNLASAGPSQ